MRNRRLPLALMFVVVVMVLIGWQFGDYSFSAVSPIEKVEIEGEFENISHDDFREKVVAVIDAGYFSLDLDAVRDELMDLPWVDDVSVRRQWPSGLRIKVTEKRALAYWNESAMISSRGDVFRPETIDSQQGLPRLNGPEGLHNKMWLFLTAINKDFLSMGFNVVDLRLDDRRAWSIYFSTANHSEKIEVKLGRENVAQRLTRFVRVFSNTNKFDFNNIKSVDLRYPNGFALRMKKNTVTRNTLVREV